MKIKKALIFLCILSLLLLPTSSAFAEEPEVIREYITRKSGKIRTSEEKLLVNYTNLHIRQEDQLKISFVDGSDNVIEELKTGILDKDFLAGGMFYRSESLLGTEYVIIEIFSQDHNIAVLKLPLKIKMEEIQK